jgi:hypothetical protein
MSIRGRKVREGTNREEGLEHDLDKGDFRRGGEERVER